MGVLGEKSNRKSGGAILNANEFVLTYSVPNLVKINQGMRPWECAQTDRRRRKLVL